MKKNCTFLILIFTFLTILPRELINFFNRSIEILPDRTTFFHRLQNQFFATLFLFRLLLKKRMPPMKHSLL